MEISKQHTKRYYGEFVGPKRAERYLDPANYIPEEIPVEFVVIHCTEGFEAGDKHVLSGAAGRKVSAHYYITKKGEVIEYVPPPVRAWHAGRSYWILDGKRWSGFNNFSIGIELENRYVEDPVHGSSSYTDIQLERLYELHRSLQEKYPALRDPKRTVGHEDISGYRGKRDPGPEFDWHAFRLSVFGAEVVPPPPFSVKVDGHLLPQRLLLLDGRSYLPLRAVAQALGISVKWFSQEKRVELVSSHEDDAT